MYKPFIERINILFPYLEKKEKCNETDLSDFARLSGVMNAWSVNLVAKSEIDVDRGDKKTPILVFNPPVTPWTSIPVTNNTNIPEILRSLIPGYVESEWKAGFDVAEEFNILVKTFKPGNGFNGSTQSEAQKEVSWFDVKQFLQASFDETYVKGNTDDIQVAFADVALYQKLGVFFSSKTASELAQYAIIAAVSTFEKDRVILQAGSEPQRLPVCLQFATQQRGLLAHRVFHDSFVTNESKEKTETMIKAIREQMRLSIGRNSVLDSATRAEALKKLERMGSFVALAPELLNNTFIQEYYGSSIEIKATFFDLYTSKNTFALQENLRTFSGPLDSLKFIFRLIDAPRANAAYDALGNDILILSSALQFASFDASAPRAIQFGQLGAIVGHEITHGFDNNGREFDSEGRAVDWWTDSSDLNFANRSQCFVDQYSQFRVPSAPGSNETVPTDGKISLSENIADNGGLNVAFSAYEAELAAGEAQPRRLSSMPGFNDRQLFFLGYAQIWCGKARDAQTETLLTQLQGRADPHAQFPFRVNGVVSNSEAFAQAFQCPSGSPMNPVQKCVLW